MRMLTCSFVASSILWCALTWCAFCVCTLVHSETLSVSRHNLGASLTFIAMAAVLAVVWTIQMATED